MYFRILYIDYTKKLPTNNKYIIYFILFFFIDIFTDIFIDIINDENRYIIFL
jgi:uncharacterized membrane protein